MEDHGPDKKTLKKQLWVITLTVVLSMLVYYLPKELVASQRVVLATFIIAGIFWLTEVVPLYVTSFIIAFVLIFFGGLTPKEAFNPFFDPIIVLFMGGFVLSTAFIKYGVDEFIARKSLRLFGRDPYKVMFGLMVIAAILSMWMSNTAAAALLLPISISILKKSDISEKDPLYKAFPLAIAYAATTGGLGTIIGSPPNALAVKYLQDFNVRQITFSEWMVYMIPITVVILLVIFVVIRSLYRTKEKELHPHEDNSKISRSGKFVLVLALVTMMFWLFGSYVGLSSYLIATIPIIVLFGIGFLNTQDLNKLNWETLLLFGGGLTLGEAVGSTGVNEYIASGIGGFLSQFPVLPFYILLLLIGIAFTVVASNTGAAVVMIPVVIPLATRLGLDPTVLVLLTTIGVSLDFILPVGTPPSAIAYSSGYIRTLDMVRTGLILTIFVITIPALIALLW
ncbi:SLC13/DASS family transporter [Candidatus Dojkabacteria bacterium]|uniref:SLC13/DASS family transporter n=1 Tax=Candidatus Dojkabacteria bacterium TaxID=2099670 RepID=A0A955I2Q0_9BACT|nr:SLC13/DASS family transporter [Candidatus Dojkabacteria bacterium]